MYSKGNTKPYTYFLRIDLTFLLHVFIYIITNNAKLNNTMELSRLKSQPNPSVKDTDNISIRHYNAFHTFSANNERAAGGVSIFINNNAPHSHIHLHTNLQAVAVSITLHRVNTLCSIYIPPSSRLSLKDFDDLVPQLPSPFILLGDFNGHSIIWGSKDVNDKGRIIESFIDNHGLCLYNSKPPTYLHPATSTYTSLDLSTCFPTLLLDYDWKVHDDLCGWLVVLGLTALSDNISVYIGPSPKDGEREEKR